MKPLNPDPSGLGFAEMFTVPDTALGYLTLARLYLERGQTERAQAMVALSYQARAREIAKKGERT